MNCTSLTNVGKKNDTQCHFTGISCWHTYNFSFSESRNSSCAAQSDRTQSYLWYAMCKYLYKLPLTHWWLYKTTEIVLTTSLNAFYWVKINLFWFELYLSPLPRVQSTMCQHWFSHAAPPLPRVSTVVTAIWRITLSESGESHLLSG